MATFDHNVRQVWDASRKKVVAEYWTLNGKPSRHDGGPAETEYDPESGRIVAERYFRKGRPNREDGPWSLEWDPKTGICIREIYACYGSIGREHDMPAEIEREPEHGRVIAERWYCQNEIHRLIDPAVKEYHPQNGALIREEWRWANKLHRIGGKPALILYSYKDGTKLHQEFWLRGARCDAERSPVEDCKPERHISEKSRFHRGAEAIARYVRRQIA